MSDRDTELALQMLKDHPVYIEDARAGAPLGNSVIGSIMSLVHGVPRQYSEAAVVDALAILDDEPEEDPEGDWPGAPL